MPLLTNTALPLDSIEAVMWGSEWEWGYDKHPPLSAWAAEAFAVVFGDWGVYLLSQLCVVFAGLGVYRLGRFLKLTESQAVCAVLVLECIHFYTYSSVEFNVNVIQLPLWAWGWYFGLVGLEKRRLRYWVGLGLCVGLGALAKYIAVFMLIPLFAAWCLRGDWLRVLRTPGLWLAGVLSMLVFLPHLLWMAANDWVTITYGLDRTGSEGATWWQHLWFPLEYLLSNFAVLLPLAVMAAIAVKLGGRGEAPRGSLGLAFGAYAFMVLLSFAMGMQPVSMWAVPLPLAVGIWLVPRFQLDARPKVVLPVVGLMGLLAVIAYTVVYGFGPLIRSKPHRVNYPGQVIANEAHAAWASQSEAQLSYVIADEWLGGIVNHYGESRASVMIRGVLERSAYLNDDDIKRDGALVFWLKTRDAASDRAKSLDSVFPDLRERFPQLYEVEDLVIPWPRGMDDKAGRYGVAFIPAQI